MEIRYIVMSLDYFAAFILVLLLICSVPEKNKSTLLKLYVCMALTCAVSLLLEATSLAVSLTGYQSEGPLRETLSNLAIVFGYGLSFSYACYVGNLVGAKRRFCRRVLTVLFGVGIAALVFLVVGSVFGIFYTIRSVGIAPGRFFALVFAYDIIACLAGILLIVRYRKSLNRRDVTALMSLPTLIFFSALLQYSIFEMMYCLFLMAAVSIFIIYLMIQTDRNRQKVEQDKLLVDMNIAMMISQIQPHFLYNALSSIRRMIRKDPAVAEVAVENFAQYLRQNLESMNRREPISFSTELKHVEEYLYLEKLRFGERLSVEYDIGFTDFVLPVLTLQPIVENAVKHGVLRREEGGCVRLTTRREGGAVILTVEDNGVGFDPETDVDDGRLHIGLNNVESRIKIQCNGTVQIESRPGEGSTVTMTIPLT